MQISLRRAHKLTRKIQNKIREGGDWRHTLPVFQPNHFSENDWLETARSESHNDLTARVKLTRVMYTIRRNIQATNEDVGINQCLNDVAALKAENEVLRQLVHEYETQGFETTAHYLSGRRQKLKETEREGYGTSDRITVTVMTEAQYDEAQGEIERHLAEIEILEERLAELNAGSKIHLTDREVEVLTDNGLLRG